MQAKELSFLCREAEISLRDRDQKESAEVVWTFCGKSHPDAFLLRN